MNLPNDFRLNEAIYCLVCQFSILPMASSINSMFDEPENQSVFEPVNWSAHQPVSPSIPLQSNTQIF